MPYAFPRSLRLPFCVLLTAFLLLFPIALKAQTPALAPARTVSNRILQPIDESNRVILRHTVHPLIKALTDHGAVPDSMKLERVQIVLKRTDAQEASLKQLIKDLHTPGSAQYHHWLSPDAFGQQFGPSDADVATIEAWLQSRGFTVEKLNPGRQTLEFSGTAAQFRTAFHTAIHSYPLNGRLHYANISDPQIPAALAPVFAGFASLNNFPVKSQARLKGAATYNTATHVTKPSWTLGNGSDNFYALSPGDLAVQYDLNPLYTASKPLKGDGQTIAIINDSNIDIAMANRFRSLFNLPYNPPQVIIDGNDPGVDGINDPYGPNNHSGEAYIDVEWSGAVAPNATIDLVIAGDTALNDGLLLASERAVYSNIAPIISVSFLSCESALGFSNETWSGLWEQAAAQGITVFVAAGDGGSAGCDDFDTQDYAVFGQAVNGLASTPFNVAVGGTDFYYSNYNGSSDQVNAQVASYWNTTPSNSNPTVSLTQPIPEQTWNGSQFGLNVTGYGYTIAAGSGGASSCISSNVTNADGSYSQCTTGYPKPSWQTGAGVPSDGVRDLPDVSLFASNGYNLSAYAVCAGDGDCQPVQSGGTVQISGYGGTSVASPAFAGVMALVDEKYGRQGQANYILYPLATQYPAAFHDVVNGSNSVPCNTTTVTNTDGNSFAPNDCLTVSGGIDVTDTTYGNTVEGQIGLNGVAAYNAGPGYDMASGLGTIDAANLVNDWGNIHTTGSVVTLTPSSTSFPHGTTITVSGSVTGNSPTGDVALMTSSSGNSQQSSTFYTLSGGSFSGSLNYLPGGTYTIWGHYAGDANNAESDSTPVSITVSPETSITSLSAYTSTGNQITATGSYIYGSSYILSSTSTPSSGTFSTAATGHTTFSDNGTAIDNAVINSNGEASYTYPFSAGAHSLTAAYSGDSSYGASTSAPLTFTVAKATPYLNYSYFSNGFGALPGGQSSIIPISVRNSTTAAPAALPPTGTITLTGGPAGTPATLTLQSGVDPTSGVKSGITYLTIPATAAPGIYNLNISYSGDTNYTSLSSTYQIQIGGPSGGYPSTVTASISSATSPNALVEVTATVAGSSSLPAPTGTLYLLDATTLDYLAYTTLPTATSANSVTVSFVFDSETLPPGIGQFIIYYPGDVNYRLSEAVVTLNNSRSDFSLVPDTTIVTVPSTGAVNDAVNLSSLNGFTGTVYLSCTSSTGVACSIAPSATLTSGSNTTLPLTINTAGVTSAGTYNVVVTASDSTGTYVHNIGLQVTTPVIATGTAQGPLGNLELAVDNATHSPTVLQNHALFVSGWAADPVDGAPLTKVQLYLDGLPFASPTMGVSRPDVATHFNKSSYTDSGFNLSYSATNLWVGAHTLLAIVTDAAGYATTLGPLTFTVKPVAGPPVGNLEMAVDSVTTSTTVSQQHQVFIAGWIADPVDGSPLSNVKVSIDGTSVGAPTMGVARPDVAAYFHNNNYANAGYQLASYVGGLTIGSHSVTVTGTDSNGLSTTFGPLSFTVAAASTPPIGNLERAVDSVSGSSTLGSSSTLFVGGWAADYHDDGPAKSVQILIDGTAAGYATLGLPRPDVESYYGNSAWSNTGWSFDYSVASLATGSHSVTAIAKDSLGLTSTFGPISFTISPVITTYAGDAITGYSGDGGAATSASLSYPYSVAVDKAGNLYIADTYNFAIRKVTPAGIISTVAGSGVFGNSGDGSAATAAKIGYVNGVAVDQNGNLYLADSTYSVIRMVNTAGNISTFAGTGVPGYTGDGGAASAAQLQYPAGVAVDQKGNVYISDALNYAVRKVDTTGTISTIAGTGVEGYSGDGGPAVNAQLSELEGITVDIAGNLYISDFSNCVVREVTAAGVISTVAGNGSFGYTGDGGSATLASLGLPSGVAVDSVGNLYISDYGKSVVREVTPAGLIYTVAGNGTPGYTGDGGPAIDAQLRSPGDVATDEAGNLYIADTQTSVIRKVTQSSGSSQTPASASTSGSSHNN